MLIALVFCPVVLGCSVDVNPSFPSSREAALVKLPPQAVSLINCVAHGEWPHLVHGIEQALGTWSMGVK